MMNLLSLIAFCLLSSFYLGRDRVTKEWRGIVPLHSTRTDVEKVLNVKSSSKFVEVFELDGESVMIVFAEHPCKKSYEKWNVPIGTVLEIGITPKTEMLLSDLNIDIKTFKKTIEVGKDIAVTRYADENNGFIIETAKGKVIGLSYLPTKKDDHLLCSQK